MLLMAETLHVLIYQNPGDMVAPYYVYTHIYTIYVYICKYDIHMHVDMYLYILRCIFYILYRSRYTDTHTSK